MPTGNTLKWIVVAAFALHSVVAALGAIQEDVVWLRVMLISGMAGWAIMSYHVATTPWNKEESDG